MSTTQKKRGRPKQQKETIHCSFRLPKTTKAHLWYLAEAENSSPVQVLTALIDETYQKKTPVIQKSIPQRISAKEVLSWPKAKQESYLKAQAEAMKPLYEIIEDQQSFYSY